MKSIKSATDLYLEDKLAEFIETLPTGLLMRQWIFFNLAACFTFLNGLVNDMKILPDWAFLAYMGVIFINQLKFDETGEKL